MEKWANLDAPVSALAAADDAVLCAFGDHLAFMGRLSLSHGTTTYWPMRGSVRHVVAHDGFVAVSTGDRTGARRLHVAELPEDGGRPRWQSWAAHASGDDWEDPRIDTFAFLTKEHLVSAGESLLVLSLTGAEKAGRRPKRVGSLRVPGGPLAARRIDEHWWELAVGPSIERLTRWQLRPSFST